MTAARHLQSFKEQHLIAYSSILMVLKNVARDLNGSSKRRGDSRFCILVRLSGRNQFGHWRGGDKNEEGRGFLSYFDED